MTKDKSIDNELIHNLLKDYKKPEDLIGDNGLLKQLTKQLLERAMAAELTEHVGYEKHDPGGHHSGNSRNGKSAKTIKGSFGDLALETPRDRNGTFEPQIIEKHQTRFTGFDQNIISLYARGLSTREIQQHLEEIYHVEVSPALISSVTDEVIDEVKTWQNRQLDAVYPIMYLDAIQFKVRDSGHVKNKAIYLAIGVTIEGYKEVLGLWIAQTEGAKFWLQVVTELKNRGVTDIFIACVELYFTTQIGAIRVLLARMGGPRVADTLEAALNKRARDNHWPMTISLGEVILDDNRLDGAAYRALLEEALDYAANVIGRRVAQAEMQTVDGHINGETRDVAEQAGLRVLL